MIITRTPNRISLFGGSTDYPEYFQEHGAVVIGGAIDKYSYISVRHNSPFLDFKTRLAYSEVETVKNHLDIRHRVIREALRLLSVESGISLSHCCDLPDKTGIGSSSTFVVALIHALQTLKNDINTISKSLLANLAIHLERDILCDTVGYQDQIWAAFGGINEIEFIPTSTSFAVYNVSPMDISNDFKLELEKSLLLLFTGITRSSSTIANTYLTSDVIRANIDKFHYIKSLALEAKKTFKKEDIRELGKLLHESWLAKKHTGNSVSTILADDIYEKAIRNGAYGGKLIGAGGGGFLLLMIDSNQRQYFKELFRDFTVVDFKFDFKGSTILYNSYKESDKCND